LIPRAFSPLSAFFKVDLESIFYRRRPCRPRQRAILSPQRM
jgi:hypothetical protein